MKIFVSIFIIFSSCFVQAQNKKELIESIIKYNIFESNCVGIACERSSQFNNFEKLKKILTYDELSDLTKHSNNTLRIYAECSMLEKGKNIIKIFENELKNNEMVETQDGCIGGYEYTYSVIYHQYWNKVRLEAISKNDSIDEIRAKKMHIAVENDSILKLMDSLIINSKKDLYWLLYLRAFENRKYSQNLLSEIKKLAYKKDNSYAFNYLIKNEFENEKSNIEFYLKNSFMNGNFDDENKIYYLHHFIEYLLGTNNENYISIARKKLSLDKYWKKYHSAWFENTFRKHKIKL